MLIVFFISIVIFAFDFEKEKYYQPLKSVVIFVFLSITMKHFINLSGGVFTELDFDEVP